MAIIHYPNGDRHIGETQGEQTIGVVTLEFSNGDRYVDEFQDNQSHGIGTLIHANAVNT